MPLDRYPSNFSERELTFSRYALRHNINNEIQARLRPNLILLAWALQSIRDEINKWTRVDTPIIVNSAYRCRELNDAIGGSPMSAHTYGLAADIVVPNQTTIQVAQHIKRALPLYDQIINEHDRWVHFGLKRYNGEQRRQDLSATVRDGKTKYISGFVIDRG